MKMVNSPLLALISLLLVLVITDLTGQRRSRGYANQRESIEEEVSPTYSSFSIGSLGISNGGISISAKYSYAYRPVETISFGGSAKAFYDLVNIQGGSDQSLFSYAAGAFTRLSVTKEIFVQGEYMYGSYDIFRSDARYNKLYPAIGGGYRSGYGERSFGIHIMIPLDQTIRDAYFAEYWIDFHFNF